MVTADRVIVTERPPLVRGPWTRISWGAILAGVMIALVVQGMLHMLGLSFAAAAFAPEAAVPAFDPGINTAAVIWIASATLLGIFAGGYVAGRLSGSPDPLDGILNGLIVWALGTIIVFLLLTSSASNLFNGVASGLGQGLTLLGGAVEDVAPEVADALDLQQVTLNSIREEVGALETEDGESVSVDVLLSVGQLLREDAESESISETRQVAVNALADQTGLSQAEAEAQIQRWENDFRQISAQADEIAEQAAGDIADAIAVTAGIIFMMLVVGAFAGGAGGYVGAPEPYEEVVAVAT